MTLPYFGKPVGNSLIVDPHAVRYERRQVPEQGQLFETNAQSPLRVAGSLALEQTTQTEVIDHPQLPFMEV